MGKTANYYDLLRVPESADVDAIRTAFRRSIRIWHPDCLGVPGANADNPMMAEEYARTLIEAYRTLSHPERRKAYDRRRTHISVTPTMERRKVNRRAPLMPKARQARPLGEWPSTAAMIGLSIVSGWTILPDLFREHDVGYEILQLLTHVL